MKTRWLHLLVFLMVILSHATACQAVRPQPTPTQTSGVTSISLNSSIDYDKALVRATEIVHYTNRTGRDLSSLVLHTPPPHFGFSLDAINVNGAPANYNLDGIVLEIFFALEPDQSCEIELQFTVTLPEYSQMKRTSLISGVLILGNWFPTMAVFEDGNWDRHQWSWIGDPFYTESTNFEVEITVDAPLVIASTGELVSHEDNHWKFRAENVRDFAIAVGPLLTKSIRLDGIEVTIFYTADEEDLSNFILAEAAEEIREMNASVGPYPYDSFDVVVVPTPSDRDYWGMEYPTIIMLYGFEDLNDRRWVSIITRHETDHQWFYGIIGNDQLEEPWLDEAFAVLFSEDVSGKILPGIDRSVWEFANWQEYSATIYTGGAVFLGQLRNLMGDDTFLSGMKDYYNRYKFGIADGKEFFAVMQSHSSRDLAPLFKRYFDEDFSDSSTTK